MIALRLVQLLTLVPLLVGVWQLLPLSSEIRLAISEQSWDLGRVCLRVAAVTGPILGAALVAYLVELAIRDAKQLRQLKAAHPQEPWLHRSDWAAKHMRHSNRSLIVGSLWFMAIYVLVMVPLAIASAKLPLMIFVGVFGLVALLILYGLVSGKGWNEAELRISTLPGVIGGPFSGAVVLKGAFPPDTIFDVNLTCELTYRRKHHKKTEDVRRDLWSSTIYIQRPLPGGPPGTTSIPVSFAIPYDARPSGIDGNETIRWMLTIQKKEDVSTGSALFEVPVFRTADSRRDYEFDEELMQEHLAVLDPALILKRYGIHEQSFPDGSLRMNFRDFDRGIFFTLIVMSLILIVPMWVMWHWITDPNTLLFAMVFPGAFLAMFLWGILHMLLWRCQIDLVVSDDADQPETLAELNVARRQSRWLLAKSGWLGMRKSLQLPAQQGTVLRCRIDHRANNKESWSIWLHGQDKQSLKLLGALSGAPEAQKAAQLLADKLGISVSKIKAEDGYLR